MVFSFWKGVKDLYQKRRSNLSKAKFVLQKETDVVKIVKRMRFLNLSVNILMEPY
jgi:hypothetical protein